MLDFLPVLVSIIVFSLSAVLTKTTINQSGRYKAIVYMYVFLSLLLFCGAILLGLHFSFPSELIFPYVVQILIGAFAVIAYFKAVENGKIALLSPLTNLYVVLVIAIGVIFFSESISIVQLFGILIVLCAALVISFENVKKLKLEGGVLLLLLAAVGWGYYYSFIKIFVTALGAYMATFFLESGITAIVLSYYLVRKKDMSLPSFEQSKQIFLRSSLCFVGAITYSISIIDIGVVLTAGVSASQPVLDVVLSYFILKEKLSFRKYLAVVVMVAGLLVLLLA